MRSLWPLSHLPSTAPPSPSTLHRPLPSSTSPCRRQSFFPVHSASCPTMSTSWTATLTTLLLLLSLLSPAPSCGQQVGYQYIQTAVGGTVPSIFLNLWGTLGGCGAGTSEELYVQSISGPVLGDIVMYPMELTTLNNCVYLVGRTLDSSGLGYLDRVNAGADPTPLWLYNTVASPDAADNHTLALQYNPRLPEAVLYLQPPVLVPLTGPSAGPSVGLLFNGGFEQTVLAQSINFTQDLAAGWTGEYTVMHYSAGGSVLPAPKYAGPVVGLAATVCYSER